MAKLERGRDGTTLFIQGIEGMSMAGNGGSMFFRDGDGAGICIASDTLAHLVGVAHHELSRRIGHELSLQEMYDALINATPPKG